MEFNNLPDDVLIHIFNNYLNLNDLFSIFKTCKRFYMICQNYKIFSKFMSVYPIIDFSYPSGYDRYD
jgi:hypothetical protein